MPRTKAQPFELAHVVLQHGVRMRRFLFVVVLSFCSGLLNTQSAFTQTYNLTDMGTLGGMQSFGQGINDSGQVGWL